MLKPTPITGNITAGTTLTSGEPSLPPDTLATEIASARPLPPGVVEEGGQMNQTGRGRPASLLTFMDAFTVGTGGALGSVGRYALAGWITWRWGALPLGILVVNATGSFAIGLLDAATGPEGLALIGPHGRRFLVIGVCGGYTTFSSFALQSLDLTLAGHRLAAMANVLLSFGLCLASVWAGQAAATRFGRRLRRAR